MDENILSVGMEGIRFKLRVLSGLLMGLDDNSIELEIDEIHALGVIILEISDEIKDLNREAKESS